MVLRIIDVFGQVRAVGDQVRRVVAFADVAVLIGAHVDNDGQIAFAVDVPWLAVEIPVRENGDGIGPIAFRFR